MILRLAILLLDLVLLFSVSNSTPTFVNFALVIIFAIKVRLSTVVHWHPHLNAAPSKFINSLLKSTLAPRGENCPICLDDFDMAHKISCNHTFCRDCALLTFAKRDTCPICLRVPVPLCDIEVAVPTEHLLETWETGVMWWLVRSFTWSLGWIASCIWRLRLPTSSEIMLAAMGTSIELAFWPMVDDILHSIARNDRDVEQGRRLAGSIATACALVVTSSRSLGAVAYFALQMTTIVGRVLVWRRQQAGH